MVAVLDEQRVGPLEVSWMGHLEGMAGSQVRLVVEDGQLTGDITWPGAAYQVRYLREGQQVVYELDLTTWSD